jgi:hypothetical protein
MTKDVKIKWIDWEYIKAALRTYEVESFQSKSLQYKISELLEKYN